MEKHNERVSVLAMEVRYFYDRKTSFRIYHGSTNSTRPLAFQRDKIINTSHLSHVVGVNRLKQTALVEPNVSMAQLVDATLQSGLMPQVVMEFPGITVGGGFAGTSAESSSFKHGYFESTISEIEIVLANGDVVKASPTTNSDLFEGAKGTFGTLGVITLLEVQLVKAKRLVRLDFLPTKSVDDAIKKLEKATGDTSNDYVDGILFSSDQGVIMAGQLTDTVGSDIETVQFSHPANQWFYRFAEKKLAADAESSFTIAIPLVDYLFRYDRGAFWVGKYAFSYFLTPYNRITRYLLDSFMHASVMYHALHESGFSQKYIIQDIRFPGSTIGEFIQYLDQNFGFYPLWLCPLRDDAVHARALPIKENGARQEVKDMSLNVGVWGPGPTDKGEFIRANRRLEQKTRELSGIKWLYARSYYTEDEFWDIYDRKWYDGLRTKYHANTLPTLYDKVKSDLSGCEEPTGVWSNWPLNRIPGFWDIWPTAGLYGVFKAFMGLYSPVWNDYLIAKPTWKEYLFTKKRE